MNKLNYEHWQRKATRKTGIFKREEISQLVVDRALKDILETVNQLIDKVKRFENETK